MVPDRAAERALQRIDGKPQRDGAFRRCRREQPCVDNVAEHAPGSAHGQPRNAGCLAAIDPAADQGFAQQARGFGFQRVAALDMARQAGVQTVEVEEFPHEGHLVEAYLQKPEREVDKSAAREVAGPIQIAVTRRIGAVHPSLVFPAAVEAPGETARHRPQAMGADAGLQRHGVAHETAHPAIAVGEGVNVIQPVMRGRHGQDARRRTAPSKR